MTEPARKTYDEVHAELYSTFGRASQFPCIDCDSPAQHWSYQHTAGDNELRSENGAPYSEDLNDYATRCRSCHVKFDVKMEPRLREARQEAGRAAAERLREYYDDPEWCRRRSEAIQATKRRKRELGI